MECERYRKPSPRIWGEAASQRKHRPGCSPAVARCRSSRSTAREAALYPDYDEAQEAVAARARRHAAITSCSPTASTRGFSPPQGPRFAIASGGVPEALGVTPAFDMYEVSTTALAAEWSTVPLGAELRVSLRRTSEGDLAEDPHRFRHEPTQSDRSAARAGRARSAWRRTFHLRCSFWTKPMPTSRARL